MRAEPKKKIFIHIGTPKTGTTALQAFFTSHTSALAKKNIVYPVSGRRRNQHFYLAIPQSNNQKLVKKVWQSLYDELDSTQWNTAVISSERFSREDPMEVFNACKRFNADIHIVVFFRERKALLSSHYRTAIKTGARVCCTADAFIPFWFERSDVFNYDALIRRWRDPFGDDNVHVLSYDQVVENNNSATAFLTVMDENGVPCSLFSEEELGLRVHETQSDIALDLLLRSNQLHYGDFPYWKVIRDLFNMSNELNIDSRLTTSSMQITDEGLCLLDEKMSELGIKFLSYFSSEAQAIYNFNQAKTVERKVISDSERIDIQLELLNSLSGPIKKALLEKTKLTFDELVNVEIKTTQLEHYKVLFKRDHKQLMQRLEQDTFNMKK
ncbi:MAG: hypothetical protein RPR97_10835 [Colwellia sp.]